MKQELLATGMNGIILSFRNELKKIKAECLTVV